jgi:Holliday junction resolvasome RuvABC ATP-dependent DNA helicase subunit
VGQAAERLGIDARGLDRVDREALKLLVGRGKAIGIKGIATVLGLDLETFEEVHEPWLERSGLTTRRRAGKLAEGSAPGSRRE